MDYRVSDEGAALRQGLQRYLHARMPRPGDLADDGPIWEDLASSGWLEAYAIASDDGDPATLVEALHIVEAFGETPMPGPVAVVAGFVLPLMRTMDASDLEEQVRDGWVLVAELPHLAGQGGEARGRAYRGNEAVLSERHGGLRANGVLELVLGGDRADAVLIPVRQRDRTVLAVAALDAPGVSRSVARVVDLRFGVARVQLDDVEVRVVSDGVDIDTPVHRAASLFSLFLDAEAVGGASEMTKRTVAYTSERFQFGRPVGSFQAVRHKIADMAVLTETARALTYQVGWDLAAGSPDAVIDLLASRRYASAVYVTVCEAAIQCHGGVGFTWDRELHVWYRCCAERPRPSPISQR